MNRFLVVLVITYAMPASCGSAPRSMIKASLSVIANTSAQQVDSTLPPEDLTAWLNHTFNHPVKWTIVPGCGDTHHERDNRVCAVAMIPFSDDLEAGIYIDVGDRKQIIGPARLDFAFWDEQRTGNRFHQVEKLSEYPEIIARTKK